MKTFTVTGLVRVVGEHEFSVEIEAESDIEAMNIANSMDIDELVGPIDLVDDVWVETDEAIEEGA